MEKLQKRKEELVEQIGEDKIKKIKKFKLLKLLETQIYELMNYWTLGQILQMINNEFKLNISKTVFYDFCRKNFKKDEISKPIKNDKKLDKGVVEEITTNKKETSILDEDELNVIDMYSN